MDRHNLAVMKLGYLASVPEDFAADRIIRDCDCWMGELLDHKGSGRDQTGDGHDGEDLG